MSYSFSKTSKKRLEGCHPYLQLLFNELIKEWDITILEGHRDKATQDKAVAEGKSKTKWPNSKHNAKPSMAVDAILYPIDWDDNGRNYMFVGIVKQKAKSLGINIRCGADWLGNNSTKDQTFNDLVHFELVL